MLSSFGSLGLNFELINMPLRHTNLELGIKSFALLRHPHNAADIRISQPKNRNPGFGRVPRLSPPAPDCRWGSMCTRKTFIRLWPGAPHVSDYYLVDV